MALKARVKLKQLVELLRTQVDWSKESLRCADVAQLVTDLEVERIRLPVKPATSPREAVAFARALFLELKQKAGFGELIGYLSIGPASAVRQ